MLEQLTDRRGEEKARFWHTLGATSRIGGALLHKQVPLLGQAPSELTHLAGKCDSFKHLPPIICALAAVQAGAAPAWLPVRGWQGQQPPVLTGC